MCKVKPFVRLCVFAICLFGTMCGTSFAQTASKPEKLTSFQLYYGGDANLLQSLRTDIKRGQLVVVDIRGLTAYQFGQVRRRANEVNAKLIGYISIGELHSREVGMFEAFARKQNPGVDIDKLKSRVFISKNTSFSSLHVDVVDPIWREFVFDKVKNMYAAGVDGLFLDTVDTVDVYAGKKEWDLDRRGKSVTGMISLIRDLKKQDPSRFIMQNRGLNLIGKEVFVGDETGKMIPGLSLAESHPHNPDALLYEDAFSSEGTWTVGVLKNLDAIQDLGETTVVALGYEAALSDRQKYVKQCGLHSFLPAWAKDSHSLHLEIAK